MRILPANEPESEIIIRLEAVRDAGNVSAVVGATSDKHLVQRQVANLDGLVVWCASVLARDGAGRPKATGNDGIGNLDHTVGNAIAERVALTFRAAGADGFETLPVLVKVTHLHRVMGSRTLVDSRSAAATLDGGRCGAESGEGEDEGKYGLHFDEMRFVLGCGEW
jgi:hypothetical protein